jgi:hypothetical protein
MFLMVTIKSCPAKAKSKTASAEQNVTISNDSVLFKLYAAVLACYYVVQPSQ